MTDKKAEESFYTLVPENTKMRDEELTAFFKELYKDKAFSPNIENIGYFYYRYDHSHTVEVAKSYLSRYLVCKNFVNQHNRGKNTATNLYITSRAVLFGNDRIDYKNVAVISDSSNNIFANYTLKEYIKEHKKIEEVSKKGRNNKGLIIFKAHSNKLLLTIKEEKKFYNGHGDRYYTYKTQASCNNGPRYHSPYIYVVTRPNSKIETRSPTIFLYDDGNVKNPETNKNNTGSSFATPRIGGLSKAIQEVNPSISPREVAWILAITATPKSHLIATTHRIKNKFINNKGLISSNMYGRGKPDLKAALYLAKTFQLNTRVIKKEYPFNNKKVIVQDDFTLESAQLIVDENSKKIHATAHHLYGPNIHDTFHHKIYRNYSNIPVNSEGIFQSRTFYGASSKGEYGYSIDYTYQNKDNSQSKLVLHGSRANWCTFFFTNQYTSDHHIDIVKLPNRDDININCSALYNQNVELYSDQTKLSKINGKAVSFVSDNKNTKIRRLEGSNHETKGDILNGDDHFNVLIGHRGPDILKGGKNINDHYIFFEYDSIGGDTVIDKDGGVLEFKNADLSLSLFTYKGNDLICIPYYSNEFTEMSFSKIDKIIVKNARGKNFRVSDGQKTLSLFPMMFTSQFASFPVLKPIEILKSFHSSTDKPQYEIVNKPKTIRDIIKEKVATQPKEYILVQYPKDFKIDIPTAINHSNRNYKIHFGANKEFEGFIQTKRSRGISPSIYDRHTGLLMEINH